MKLAVHGTKDGYRILYTTNDEFARIISRDIRKGAQGDEQLGKTAYSLAFVSNGCAYSKYVIVKDSLRSFATGTIAFSIFVGVDEAMKAEDIFNLLNELYNSYETEYIRNYYLNRGEKELIRENWSFINDILGKYKTTPNTKRHEIINSGTKDPAFIYYRDDTELFEYFDKPFQVEYSDYSQILFIQRSLQGATNPINVLKNSGIALNIDLKNEPYYLSNYNRNKKITITANGRLRSEGKYNNIIWTKDVIDIFYSKDDQCYYPIHENGLLFEPKIKKYLEIKNNDIIINYENFENPDPIIKTIVFEIKNHKKDPIDNAEIQIGENAWVKVLEASYEYAFKGEDLKKRFTVLVKKGNFSGERIVVPINEIRNVELILKERKKVEFDIINEDLLAVSNFSISVKNPTNVKFIGNNVVEFIDEAIDRDCCFTITASGYESKTDILYPRQTEQLVQIRLKKRIQKTYYVDAGEKGTASAGYSHEEDGNNITVFVKADGYIFTGFKLDRNRKTGNFDGTLIAQYKKDNYFENPKKIAFSIVVMIVLGFGMWALYSLIGKSKPVETQQPDVQHVKAYIEGNSLILDTLKSYKNILNGGPTDVLQSLDSAIKKRGFIDDFNIPELKKFDYSKAQKIFQNAIDKIDSTQYDDVKSRLGNISSWSLGQIADSINAFLTHAKPSDENKPEKREDVEEEKKENKEEQVVKEDNKEKAKKEETQQLKPKQKSEELQREIKQPTNAEQKEDKKQDTPPANTDNKINVTQKLQSATVNKDELQRWNTAEMGKYKSSIDLYLHFWKLVLDGNNRFESFDLLRKDVKRDPILQRSELKNFLDGICKDSKTFNNSYQDKINKVQKTNSLTLKKLIDQLSSK